MTPRKPLLLDSNLLVLLFIGLVRPDLIGKHKRVSAYTTEDLTLLGLFISEATEVVVTPNTLTEASNLLGFSRDALGLQLSTVFKEFVVGGSREEIVFSVNGVSGHRFFPLGLTDEVLLQLVQDGTRRLLTADLDLFLAAKAMNADAVNFHRERERFGTV